MKTVMRKTAGNRGQSSVGLLAAIVAATSIAAVAITWIGIRGVDKRGPQTAQVAPTLFQIIDCSGSSAGLRDRMDCWSAQMRGGMPLESALVICRMSNESHVVADFPEMPSPAQLRRSGSAGGLKIDRREVGTRPLVALRRALDWAKAHHEPMLIAIIGDGENDFLDDTNLIAATCKGLAGQSNVVGIGVFGPERAAAERWESWLRPFDDRAIVGRSTVVPEKIRLFTQLAARRGEDHGN